MNNNKLIAEFMGMTRHDHDDGCMIQMTHQGNEVVLVASMKYHTSWDWLMPVVEKIEEIAIEDDNLTVKEHRYQVDMSYTQCSIYDHVRDRGESWNSKWDGVTASADMGTKLLSTHRAVVEFIKEYNNG
jgi:hypothetical protein